MKIENIMSKNLIVADINSDIYEIAKQMKEYDIGFMPVGEEKKIIGVITDRDIVTNIISNKDDKIKGYITKNIIKINVNESVEKAIELMGNKRIKRLLVEDNKKLIGILSMSDIFNNFNDEFVYENIKKIFTIYRNDNDYVTKVDEFKL